MDVSTAVVIGAAIYGIFKHKNKKRPPPAPTQVERPRDLPEDEEGDSYGQIERDEEDLAVDLDGLGRHILAVNSNLDAQTAADVAEAIQAAAGQSGIHSRDLAALIQLESRYNPAARSPSGAVGLGQLTPAAASDAGVTDPTDPRDNALGAAVYLSKCIRPYSGEPDKLAYGLAAYRIGPGAVKRALDRGEDILADPVVSDYLSRFNTIRAGLNHF